MIRFLSVKKLIVILMIISYIFVYRSFKEEFLSENDVSDIENVVDNLLFDILELKVASSEERDMLLDEKYEKLRRIKTKLKKILSVDTKQRPSKQNTTFKKKPTFQKEGLFSKTTKLTCDVDIFKGPLYGHPRYLKGFIREKCAIDWKELVTIIFIDPFDYEQIRKDSNLGKHYVISTYLQDDKNHIFRYGKEVALGNVLNKLIANVTTPYTLIAANIAEWNNPNLIRLVNVIEKEGLSIAGGSSKDVSSFTWNRGCFQTNLKFYILKIFPGYYESKLECIYCDFTDNPFLASTELLSKLQFNNLINNSVFLDFFMRLKKARKATVVCPDVMFIKKTRDVLAKDFVSFVQAWDIKKIEWPHETMWFGCRRGFNHTTREKCKHLKGMIVPPCCIENLKDGLVYLFSLCEKHAIKCVLQEGSVLGIVKFSGILPWERDVDISIPVSQFNQFLNLSLSFDAKGFTLVLDEESKCCNENNEFHGGVMHVRVSGWSFQIFSQQKLNKKLTKYFIRNQAIYLPENPGLYARNRYGYEIYKHAEHWMFAGMKSGWENYTSGHFQNCSIPDHHACLDQLSADGDLIFKN